MDVDKFVDEFFQATGSPGHMLALMVRFREASSDVQDEIMQKIKQRREYRRKCDLTTGGRPEKLRCRGIRPRG